MFRKRRKEELERRNLKNARDGGGYLLKFASKSLGIIYIEILKTQINISSMLHVDRSRFLTKLHGALERSGVVAILGPRQCGKTTLARDFCATRADVIFLDMENPGDAARLAEPLLYLERQSGLVVLDEVQLMPQLLPVLRVLADRRPLPAKFLLLGSASPDLVRGASESLAGRVEFLEMSGFGLDEVDGEQDTLWWRGGFPRSFLARNDGDARIWQQDFAATFLERDLRKFGIGIPPAALRRLWTVCAHYHGQIWNSSSVAGGLGESSRTVKSHLDILTGTFMLRQLQPWQENLMKRQVKAPRVYLRDTGILHSLLDVPSMDALFAHPKFGASWEGFAIEQICGAATRSQAFYWATHAGAELDLLLFHNGKRLGFECKVADAPRVTKSMHVAIADLRLDHLYVITPREAEFPLTEKITASGLQGCLRQLLA